MEKNKMKKDVDLGMDLNWLEKNLIGAKLGHRTQNEGRQRKVMMRL